MQLGWCYHAHAPKGRMATSYSVLTLLQGLSGLSETGETLLFKQKINTVLILDTALHVQWWDSCPSKLSTSWSVVLSWISVVNVIMPDYMFSWNHSSRRTIINWIVEGFFFFNPWKRTHWKIWPQSHSLLQTFTETWHNIIRNFVVFEQLIKMETYSLLTACYF